MNPTRIAIFYDVGAASVAEIINSVPEGIEVVFVVDESSVHYLSVAPIVHAMQHRTVSLSGRSCSEIAHELLALDVRGLTTFAESMLTTTSAVADLAGLDFHSRATTEKLRSKVLQRATLNEAGVSRTPFRILEKGDGEVEFRALCASLSYSAVVKPEHGEGSRGTHLIRGESDLSEVWSLIAGAAQRERFIVEEYLLGSAHPTQDWLADYVSVEILAYRGEYSLLCVTDKPPLSAPLREGGALEPSTLPTETQSEVLALSKAALSALGVATGLVHCEVKLTRHGPRIIEVNGRLGGPVHSLLTRISNLNPVKMGLLVAAGHSVPVSPVFHGYALRCDVLAPVGTAQILRVPSMQAVREIVTAYKVQVYVEPPAKVVPFAGEGGKVLSAWFAATDIGQLRRAYDEFTALLARESSYA